MNRFLLLPLFLLIPQGLQAQLSESRLLPDDGEEAEYFGWSTAVSGDYVIAGASEDDDKGPASGSAYIFKRSGRTWAQHQKLLASDGSSYDTFGNAVALSDSFAVIGAQLDDDRGMDAGALYIFSRSGDQWTESAKLTASDGAPFDHFGSSVAISGNLIVAGASLDDDNGENSGSAYVFRHGASGWTEEAKLLASDGSIDDRFEEVGISDSTIIVGAWGDQDQGDLTGSAYIFVGNGGTWTQQAKLVADDQAGGDQFGIDVSVSGDRVIIGAYANDDNGENSGSAYVFRREDNVWIQEMKLLPQDGADYDEFGLSVSLSGDFAIVGADVDDDKGENSGSAYLFHRDEGGWSQVSKITASDGSAFDYFGISVGLDELNAVVGAGGDDDNGPDAGAAYVFEGFSVPPEATNLLLPENGAVIGTDSVLLIWNRSFSGVDRYWIELSADSSFTAAFVDSAVTDTTFLAGGLQSGEVRWWRTRAHNLAGWGSFSPVWSFSIILTEVMSSDSDPAQFRLEQNYPNPFNPTTTFTFSIPSTLFTDLSIYNILGEKVTTLIGGELPPGTHTVQWKADLPSGVYFCRIQAGHFRDTKRLILVR